MNKLLQWKDAKAAEQLAGADLQFTQPAATPLFWV